ncbi:cell division protein FtsA [Patescibacteria group bacterium]|nr:cell division protein FtsA [Patescibacteria group bacterium]
MAKEDIIVGIDVGSYHIRTVIAQLNVEQQGKPRIIGVGESLSSGIRKGVIVDVEEAVSSISAALEKAERTGGVPVERAFVSVSGSHILAQKSKGVVAVSRADSEITEEDIGRAIEAASAVSVPPNHEILHVLPQNFTVDDQSGIKDPVGMNGIRLEVEALIIEGSVSYLKNLTKCIHRVGVDLESFVVTPLAASMSVLSKRQRELGVALIDIGAGTTGLSVYEEGDVLHVAILPVGSEHITNDLAIGLRTSVDIAEKIKISYGTALASEIDKKEEINLSKLDKGEEAVVSRKRVAEIVEARLSEIFSLVDKELKKIGRSGKLPGGVVLVGGGAKIAGIVDLAKEELRLPAQVGFPENLPGISDKMDDPVYAVAQGLALWAIENKDSDSSFGSTMVNAQQMAGRVKKWFKNFLP